MSIDPQAFRQTLGRYATGVTIVASSTPQGRFGMTVNSFTSVSLAPPLILFCAIPGGHTLQALLEREHFTVNILREDQRELALRFAGLGPVGELDRFQGVAYHESPASSSPWLDGCLGWLDCRLHQTVPAGDHCIVLAEVQALHLGAPGSPLLFYSGQWPVIQPSNEWVG